MTAPSNPSRRPERTNSVPIRRSLSLLLALLVTGAAQAQEPLQPAVEACALIGNDALRLACYDAAVKRGGEDTAAADDAARAARQARGMIDQYERLDRQSLPPRERARRAVGEIFGTDKDLPFDERIANDGRGSMLDSRWELAKDSKLGTFKFRPYKPVYLLPAFWSSSPNEIPTTSNTAVPAERRNWMKSKPSSS